ncbi:chalcone isomerase family protein [Pandoraea eparura]|uniref:chalcone isomerase family protein n=1 Tax=Pandoraea eparura TaxID=2508291 RepID=UPI001583F524|nr:chalcone isomerase family protein [Pandoraea eparura]
MKARHLASAIVCLVGALATSPAWSGCRDALTSAHRVGAGEFCVLGFCLYKAELWSPQTPVSADTPFALVLKYERSVSGERMVSTGIDEMQRLAPRPIANDTLNAWREDMQRAFGDVSRGDELCGVYLPGRGARFYTNGTLKADVRDLAFARAFFGIWLDPNTRAPSLRRHLLGESP